MKRQSSMLGATSRKVDSLLVLAAFAVLALLRLATLARDTWLWDEVLFTEAVRDGLDVRVSHPHAPGYPVFVRVGQALAALGAGPFRATALAGALGGWLSCVGLYLLLRAVGARREWALVGALFYALTPAVWLHGVRPLSDGPGAAAALFTAFFLVRAIRGKGAGDLAAAAACTALSVGVRPQVGLALLPAAVVAAVAVWRSTRSAKPLLVAAATGFLVSAAIWLPVFQSSGGFASWKKHLGGQMWYLTSFDSPTGQDFVRGSFWRRWFVDPVGNRVAAAALLAAAFGGAILQRRRVGVILLVFVPLAALSLAILGSSSAPRFVLGFWAGPCALAALFLEKLAESRSGRAFSAACALVLLASLAAIGAAPIVEITAKESPAVAALRTIRDARIEPDDVFVIGWLRPHAEFLGVRGHVVEESAPLAIPEGGVFVGADRRPFGLVPQRAFAFAHPLLRRITSGRYLRAEIFEGRAGAGNFVPSVARPGWLGDGNVELFGGGALSVRSETGADVTFRAEARDEETVLDLEARAASRRVTLEAGRPETISFHAEPDAERLFAVRVAHGHAVLDGFRIAARAARTPAGSE